VNPAEHESILSAAETIARIYGDTETARRLMELAAEVHAAETGRPLPICPICGGAVDVTPRIQCRGCGFVFET
jgi:hypothetical protein